MHERVRLPAAMPDSDSYPPAPWHAHGYAWAGIFRASRDATLPRGLAPLLPARWRMLALVRYLPGSTLAYDELIVGPVVRAGMRPGIYVEHISVDSVASLWGGRRVWGLPKRLARFAWHGDYCRISDENGLLASLRVRRGTSALPALPAVAAAFGVLGGRLAYLFAPVWMRPGRAELHVSLWSSRFGYRLGRRPLASVAGAPFAATFPPPELLRASG